MWLSSRDRRRRPSSPASLANTRSSCLFPSLSLLFSSSPNASLSLASASRESRACESRSPLSLSLSFALASSRSAGTGSRERGTRERVASTQGRLLRWMLDPCSFAVDCTIVREERGRTRDTRENGGEGVREEEQQQETVATVYLSAWHQFSPHFPLIDLVTPALFHTFPCMHVHSCTRIPLADAHVLLQIKGNRQARAELEPQQLRTGRRSLGRQARDESSCRIARTATASAAVVLAKRDTLV